MMFLVPLFVVVSTTTNATDVTTTNATDVATNLLVSSFVGNTNMRSTTTTTTDATYDSAEVCLHDEQFKTDDTFESYWKIVRNIEGINKVNLFIGIVGLLVFYNVIIHALKTLNNRHEEFTFHVFDSFGETLVFLVQKETSDEALERVNKFFSDPVNLAKYNFPLNQIFDINTAPENAVHFGQHISLCRITDPFLQKAAKNLHGQRIRINIGPEEPFSLMLFQDGFAKLMKADVAVVDTNTTLHNSCKALCELLGFSDQINESTVWHITVALVSLDPEHGKKVREAWNELKDKKDFYTPKLRALP